MPIECRWYIQNNGFGASGLSGAERYSQKIHQKENSSGRQDRETMREEEVIAERPQSTINGVTKFCTKRKLLTSWRCLHGIYLSLITLKCPPQRSSKLAEEDRDEPNSNMVDKRKFSRYVSCSVLYFNGLLHDSFVNSQYGSHCGNGPPLCLFYPGLILIIANLLI